MHSCGFAPGTRPETGRSRYLFACVGVAASLLVAAPDTRAAGSDEAGAANAATVDAAPKLVVVADVAADETDNSELRAAVYDVARRHGYAPAGKLDVDAVASRESLMSAGSVTADPAELARLRTALGVAVVVRVSKNPGGAIRVAIVTKKGTDAQTVAGATSGAISAAVDQLLPHVFHAGATPTKSDQPTSPLDDARAGRLVLDEPTPERPPSPAEAWEKRGGLRPSYGAVVLASGTELHHVAFTGVAPNGTAAPGRATATGVGGGIGVRVGFMYLPVPDPNLSSGGFVAFRFGLGLDTNVFWLAAPHGYSYSGTERTVSYTSEALWVVNAPAELGFAIAAGGFGDESMWHGVLVGFAYAPAAQFSMNLAHTSGAFRVNPAGAEASVDITRLDSDRDGEEMQIRVLLSGLYPLDDAHPGMLSLGLGAIWY